VRDGLANHWAEILGPELEQVNEGLEDGRVPHSCPVFLRMTRNYLGNARLFLSA
jgi:hypothetical protein